MALQEKIHHDLKRAMKDRDEVKTSALRVLIGELQRQAHKELGDAEVLAVIKKMIKAEKETLALAKRPPSAYLAVLEGYVPEQPGEEEIKAWILANIDFGRLKSKMQAMKPIMAHFAGAVDGNTVKKILEEL